MGFFSFLPFVADDPKPAQIRTRAGNEKRLMPWEEEPRSSTTRSTPSPSPSQKAPQSWNYTSNPPGSSSKPRSTSTAKPRVTGRDAQNKRAGGNGSPNVLTSQDIAEEEGTAVSDPVYQALVNAGWETPNRTGTKRASLDSLDMTKATDLKGYDYQLTADEWTMAQNSIGGSSGYTRKGTQIPGAAPSIKGQTLKAAPMTWDAYNALSDEQRQAVDFNTLLVEARQQDLGRQNPMVENVGDYNAKVERIFGKGGGSNRPAANTVNLLDKIGFVAQGQDLDEFLSLDRAVTLDELQDFKFAEGDVTQLKSEYKTGPRKRGESRNQNKVLESNFIDVRSLENTLRVDTAAVKAAGEFLASAFADPNTSLWDFNATANAALTGTRPAATDIPFGFGLPGERATDEDLKEQTFQGLYGVVQNKGTTDIQAIWDAIDEHGVKNWTEQDTKELWDYFNTRTVMDSRAGLGAGDATIRNSTEIRQFLGL